MSLKKRVKAQRNFTAKKGGGHKAQRGMPIPGTGRPKGDGRSGKRKQGKR